MRRSEAMHRHVDAVVLPYTVLRHLLAIT